jgi:outer membrane protein assembly factor BamE (lipoprotein component of BamABCDE complex)
MKQSATMRSFARGSLVAAKISVGVLTPALLLGGCFGEVYQRGYVVPEGALQQIPLGASQEQVLIVLGTPSTVATVSGEAFYYISQRTERAVAFMPEKQTDQRVVAVYFDKERRVERIADYGVKDGKLFDYVSRTTPTTSSEASFVGYLMGLIKAGPVLPGAS